MQQQSFAEIEMPTQSSPNHQPSQPYQHHHHQQQHQSHSQTSTGPSHNTRMSSQSASISTSNLMNNPNSLNAIVASSSHCVSSSSSSPPPPSSASRHGYPNLPTSGGSATPPSTHCISETNYNTSTCYNNNNNNIHASVIMTPGAASIPGAAHCSHLSSTQQSYLQGKVYNCIMVNTHLW